MLDGLLRSSRDDEAIWRPDGWRSTSARCRAACQTSSNDWRRRRPRGKTRRRAAERWSPCSSECCLRSTATRQRMKRATRSAGASCARCWRSSPTASRPRIATRSSSSACWATATRRPRWRGSRPASGTPPGLRARGVRPPLLAANAELQLAAVVALARLSDPRGRVALQRWATSTGDVRLRAAALWGLGRLDDAGATPDLIKALDDRQPDSSRRRARSRSPAHRGRRRSLRAIAADARRPTAVRRAAIVALGRVAARPGPERQSALPGLLDVLDAGDAELARAAALAWRGRVSRARSRRCWRGHCCRAGSRLPDPAAPLQALAAWRSLASVPDEARLLADAHRRRRAAGQPAGRAVGRSDAAVARAHAGYCQELLAGALARGGDVRREALAALDGRADGRRARPADARSDREPVTRSRGRDPRDRRPPC